MPVLNFISFLCCLALSWSVHAPPKPGDPWNDSIIPPPPNPGGGYRPSPNFRYKYVGEGGSIHDDPAPDRIEVAATERLSDQAHNVGTNIISLLVRNMPSEVFETLTNARGRVGLFTAQEGTTIFPEYQHLRDRPECAGTCAGACSNTCTSDGRKYDSLAGLGGIRATCVDDNFMCTANDPYQGSSNILVHEFTHTVHQFGLDQNTKDQISVAYDTAVIIGPWDIGSYAMSNEMEYFAESSSTFFNVNHHPTSSGGMNSCGRETGHCQSEEEARIWLDTMDPDLYDAISYTFTDRQDQPGNLRICMTQWHVSQ